MNSKILIVEDEKNLREILRDYFRSKGEIPFAASNGVQAFSLTEENEYDSVLLDLHSQFNHTSVPPGGRKAIRADSLPRLEFMIK